MPLNNLVVFRLLIIDFECNSNFDDDVENRLSKFDLDEIRSRCESSNPSFFPIDIDNLGVFGVNPLAFCVIWAPIRKEVISFMFLILYEAPLSCTIYYCNVMVGSKFFF